MVTVAFLIICGVKIGKSTLAILRLLGVQYIKEHWKCLLTSWRIEEKGLGVEPVNNFLAYWGFEYDANVHIVRAILPLFHQAYTRVSPACSASIMDSPL